MNAANRSLMKAQVLLVVSLVGTPARALKDRLATLEKLFTTLKGNGN
jgi:hypothetical protein